MEKVQIDMDVLSLIGQKWSGKDEQQMTALRLEPVSKQFYSAMRGCWISATLKIDVANIEYPPPSTHQRFVKQPRKVF